MEERYDGVCQEQNRTLLVGKDYVAWTQENHSTDHRGRVKDSTTTRIFSFNNILFIECKVFSGDGYKNKLTQLKMYDNAKKRITTIDLNESSEKAISHLLNNYNSYRSL